MSRIDKSIEKVDKWLPSLGLGVRVGEDWGMTVKRNRVSFWSDENILVIIAQLCEYTKSH